MDTIIGKIYDLLLKWFHSFGSWVWSFFVEFFQWLFDKFVNIIQNLLSSCGLNVDLMWTTEIFNTVNYFFPLNETLAIVSVFFALWLSILGVKIVLKLIPTVY